MASKVNLCRGWLSHQKFISSKRRYKWHFLFAFMVIITLMAKMSEIRALVIIFLSNLLIDNCEGTPYKNTLKIHILETLDPVIIFLFKK